MVSDMRVFPLTLFNRKSARKLQCTKSGGTAGNKAWNCIHALAFTAEVRGRIDDCGGRRRADHGRPALLALRREHVALRIGDYQPIVASGDLLMYVRRHADERLLVALNLGREPTAVTFDGTRLRGEMLLSSHCDRNDEQVEHSIDLRADEGIVVALSEGSDLPR